MLTLSEKDVLALTSPADALAAVEGVFTAVAKGETQIFPVVREASNGATFGIKSGFDGASYALGLKAGGYWPGNVTKGLTNHQSTTILFDPDSGKVSAVMAGNRISALRTAAACAVSVKYLAREDAEVIGVLGAGVQVPFHLDAVMAVRKISRVVLWNRSPRDMEAIREVVALHSATLDVVERREDAIALADILITLTPSTAPLVDLEMVKPGTHIAAMGSDTKGKCELAPELVAHAGIYVDDRLQNRNIGECQFVEEGAGKDPVRGLIGEVITGQVDGRRDAADITIFDSTGIALQDLALAKRIADRALAKGMGEQVEL